MTVEALWKELATRLARFSEHAKNCASRIQPDRTWGTCDCGLMVLYRQLRAAEGAPCLRLIVAVSDDGCIGHKSKIPWRIPEDLKRFKRLTTGGTVIMGRKTFASIGKPLPDRRNIVVSSMEGAAEVLGKLGVEIARSPEEAVQMALETSAEPWVIGGARLYDALLPLVSRVELTEVHIAVPDGDTRWTLDRTGWRETFREPHDIGLDGGGHAGYWFVTLERKEDNGTGRVHEGRG